MEAMLSLLPHLGNCSSLFNITKGLNHKMKPWICNNMNLKVCVDKWAYFCKCISQYICCQSTGSICSTRSGQRNLYNALHAVLKFQCLWNKKNKKFQSVGICTVLHIIPKLSKNSTECMNEYVIKENKKTQLFLSK